MILKTLLILSASFLPTDGWQWQLKYARQKPDGGYETQTVRVSPDLLGNNRVADVVSSPEVLAIEKQGFELWSVDRIKVKPDEKLAAQSSVKPEHVRPEPVKPRKLPHDSDEELRKVKEDVRRILEAPDYNERMAAERAARNPE